MRKFITFLVLGLLLSCAPMAQFIEYDVYDNIPIYGMDDTKDIMPPHDIELAEGESYVWYLGRIHQYYTRAGVSSIEIEKDRYIYYVQVKCRVVMRNGDRAFLMKIREEGKVKEYIISGRKKYMIYEGQKGI